MCSGGTSTTPDRCVDAISPYPVLQDITGDSDSSKTNGVVFRLSFSESVSVVGGEISEDNIQVTITEIDDFEWEFEKVSTFNLLGSEDLLKYKPINRGLESEIIEIQAL